MRTRTDSYVGDPESLLPMFDLAETVWVGPTQIKKLMKVNDSDEAWVVQKADGTYPFCRAARPSGAQDDPPVKILLCETSEKAKQWILSDYSTAAIESVMGRVVWAKHHLDAESQLMTQEPLPQHLMTPKLAIEEREGIVTAIGANSRLMARNAVWSGMSEALTSHLLRLYVQYMYSARVVIWNLELWMAATAKAKDAFMDSPVRADDVAVPPQYWTYDRDVVDGTTNLSEFFQAPCPVVVTGVFVLPAKPYWEVIYAAAKDDIAKLDLAQQLMMQARLEKPGVLLCYVLTPRYRDAGYGTMLRFLPMGLWTGKCPEAYCNYLAAHRFMNLKITELREETLPRIDRRQYIKAGQAVPEIRTVLLRKVQHSSQEDDDRVARAINFSCHFLVGGMTGHWRKGKHYANGNVGEPEYVEPYMKGDPTKPFKVNRNPVVAKVRR